MRLSCYLQIVSVGHGLIDDDDVVAVVVSPSIAPVSIAPASHPCSCLFSNAEIAIICISLGLMRDKNILVDVD